MFQHWNEGDRYFARIKEFLPVDLAELHGLKLLDFKLYLLWAPARPAPVWSMIQPIGFSGLDRVTVQVVEAATDVLRRGDQRSGKLPLNPIQHLARHAALFRRQA
jgi:hypothetical protein